MAAQRKVRQTENGQPRRTGTANGNHPTPSPNPQASGGTTLSAREARQGEIILKTPARRAIFVGGLVLAAVACVFGFYFTWV